MRVSVVGLGDTWNGMRQESFCILLFLYSAPDVGKKESLKVRR
jgi:hypothetical protein